MIDETKKRLESRMLRKLHVRFGVGVKVQSLGLHHVRVEPRSKNAIAAGNSSFEAGKGKTKDGPKKMRAKDRPLENDFVSDEEFDRLLKAWFGNIARVLEPGRCFYIWGGFSNIANYPPVLESNGLYFSQAIGPVNEIAGQLWNLHEFGGVAKKRRKLKRHRFRVGQHGPIRAIRPGKFARIELRTAAQANRSRRLIEEENQRRGASKPRRYPKRPFMKPALDTHRAQLPKFWRDSVK